MARRDRDGAWIVTACLPDTAYARRVEREWKQRWRSIWPRVPVAVRDDLALLRYAQLRDQIPLLYLTVIMVVGTASTAATHDAPLLIKYVLPLMLMGGSAVRLVWWLRNAGADVSAQQARRRVHATTVIAGLICGLASFWSMLSWFETVSDQRVYYPIFMVVGGLAAAFCLSSVRCATLSVLLCGIGPVVVCFAIAGNALDTLTALVVMLGTAFLVRMIHLHHDQLIGTLMLQRELRQLAATDPLTGLANRRALDADLERRLASDLPTHIALIDLDRFKPVNDRHGHMMGDRLLAELGARLQDAVGSRATIYRLGGDEFALLPRIGADRKMMSVLTTAVLAAIAQPFVLDGIRLVIGASIGTARAKPGDSGDSLIARADQQLYAAKAVRLSPPTSARRARA